MICLIRSDVQGRLKKMTLEKRHEAGSRERVVYLGDVFSDRGSANAKALRWEYAWMF